MNLVAQFITKDTVYLLMALYQTLAFEFIADQHYFEVRLRTWRDTVITTLVNHLKMTRIKLQGQFLSDGFLHDQFY